MFLLTHKWTNLSAFATALACLAFSGPALATDADSDGVVDVLDNCLNLANANQIDTDNDGFGNRCDGDFNNNGSTNAQDNILFNQYLGTQNLVADINGNGYVNAQDKVLFRQLLGSPPGPGAAPGATEYLVTSRRKNPIKYQVIFEDFNTIPPLGLGATQGVGWGVYGSGSAVSQVGATLVGNGEPGQGNGTIQLLSGTAANDETVIAPPFRGGVGFPAFVTRLQPTRQDYILAIRVAYWTSNQRQVVGLGETGANLLRVETTDPAFPQFYWDGSTWRFRAGFGAVNIVLTVSGGAALDYHDLLASAEGGTLRLYVDNVLVSTTPAPIIGTEDLYPIIGVKTKLGGTAAAMGLDYFFWATERNPP